ncbi:Restriction enzyme BgcI subunit beta [termite gut metagenome]|uniref:Restriction enzyme BgcI subunit beta n=1 Tax=termite gut metagenome TaxID=433724 RepID=A0A5J4PF10_9ZZZZ
MIMNDILKNREWREFFIEDIFEIRPGKRLTKAMMTKGNTPFVGASDSNNGITEWTSNVNISKEAIVNNSVAILK